MKHALVTGGAGFIGSHLVDALLENNWRVTVIDNFDPFYDPCVKWDNISRHLQTQAYRLLEGDICDQSVFQNLTDANIDIIVHLAAKAGVRPSIADPCSYERTNTLGTLNVFEFAKWNHITSVVFASSSSVYGINPNVPWCENDSVLMPISPYASTKVGGELLGHVYSSLYGIRCLALRFFTVYGPRQRPDLAIHSFARKLLTGTPITLFGDGSSRRDYTYISDIVQGIVSAMNYSDSRYEVINLGNNCTTSLIELVRALEDVMNVKADLQWAKEQPGDVPQTWADICKASRLLGYAPRTSLLEGLRQFAAWLTNGEQGGNRVWRPRYHNRALTHIA